MEADIFPRARRFASRLKRLPLSNWPQVILRTGLRISTPEKPAMPENFRLQAQDDESIAQDVAYAYSTAIGYKGFLEQAGDRVEDAWTLELGPGRNFGGILGLACFGARPAVADRFLAPWEQGYHARFYQALRTRLKKEGGFKTLAPLEAVIDAKKYPKDILLRATNGGEDLSVFPDGRFDAIFSNAVMEHVRNHGAVFKELARITRPGGYGSHQVDFRDHRSFDRPLELMLLGPEDYRGVFDQSFAECGCQMRPREMKALIEAGGFKILAEDGILFAEDAYFDAFLPRLRASGSAYRDWLANDVRMISVRYVIRKPLQGV